MVQKKRMSPEENLKKNNINLPKASDPVGSYFDGWGVDSDF